MSVPDVTVSIIQRLGAIYVAHKAAETRAFFFGGFAVPPLTFPAERGEDGAFRELLHVGYIHQLAHGFALTAAGEWAIRCALVPALPTRSQRAIIEIVAEYDLEQKIRSSDYKAWISDVRLKKRMAETDHAKKSEILESLSDWYLDRTIGAGPFYKVSKWGWLASGFGGKARALLDGVIALFWERYDQDVFEIHFTVDELRQRGVVSSDLDEYLVGELVDGFRLGRRTGAESWTLSEVDLGRFVELECSDAAQYLDLRVVNEASGKRITDFANSRHIPEPAYDMEPLHLWRRTRVAAEEERPPAAPAATGAWETTRRVVEQFKHLVENRGYWRELWDADAKPRSEAASQRLFYVVASAHCEANNLDINPDTDAGPGRVDFKVSSGFSDRILVEVKLSTNTRLVPGYETQLRLYMQGEKTLKAIYLIVNVGGLGDKLERVQTLRERAIAQGREAADIVVVDATQRKSASKADNT